MMNKPNKFLFALMIAAGLQLNAQQSEIYQGNQLEYNQALHLFEDNQFQAAQILFNKLKVETSNEDEQANCDFYMACCAIYTQQKDGETLMQNYIDKYPTHTKRNTAFFNVAQFNFAQNNYTQSLEWYDKVEPGVLTNEEVTKMNFQRGYANFSIKNNKEASKFFNKVVNSNEYGNQAKYYLGYLAYDENNYEEANKLFGAVSDQEKYKEKMGYFQSDMNFKLGNFTKAIEIGEPQLKKSSPSEKSELSKIIGESYFNLKQYDKALPYLLAYRGKNGKWMNTDFYQLGYAYYKQKDYEKAIGQFNKIIEGNDAIAQNAYYHLAECYMKTEKKQQALNAFKTAAELIFDKNIQEDASLNYAKLSYEIGNPYQSTPEILKLFLETYPANKNITEIRSLLINSYITSKNYIEALEILEKNKTPENKEAYQKVTFYRALELVVDNKYQDAIKLFKKSIENNKDAVIYTRALFWKAECEYNLDQFTQAILSFKEYNLQTNSNLTPEAKTVNYNLGYTYFKLKNYPDALTYFSKQIDINKEDKVRLADAYLRAGDCNFISTKYWPAMDAYNKAIELKCIDADYAAFQKGISYGFVNKNDKKIEDLIKFISGYSTSQYIDDAYYELGSAYEAEEQNEKAIKAFDDLITKNPSSTYVVKAVLKQGIIYYNQDKDDAALVKFKKLAAEFPNFEEALEGVSTAKSIYVSKGRVDEYAAWVKTLSFVNVSDSELDDDMYQAAEKQYLSNNAKQAITSFNSYLAQFPSGKYALKVHFYLAQLYFADKLEKNAMPHYEYVVNLQKNEFTEPSLVRLSEIYLKEKKNEEAIKVLAQLDKEAEYPQNTTYAQANLMKLYYEAKNYSQSELYADKVLKNPKIENVIKSDAQIIVARSAIKTNNEVKAKEAYAKLQKIAKGELAAEALYYEAYFKNKEGKFEVSNKVVEKYASIYSGYKYFAAKALIVMAKNYFSLKDSFQATEILQSVIENFNEFSDVLEEAQTELNTIKDIEAKTNMSITK